MSPKSEFSEFNFGFAVSFERVLQASRISRGVWSLPLLPNQVIEAALGFDAMFRNGGMGVPLCLQYKIPEELTRRHLTNHSKKHHNHGLTLPAYRFHITDAQNATLLRLRGVNAFYCVPAFASQRDLERHFRNQDIWKSIKLFRVPRLSSSGTHVVYFDVTKTRCVHSEDEEYPAMYDYNDFAQINLGEAYMVFELIPRMEALAFELGIQEEWLKGLIQLDFPGNEFIDLFLRYIALKAAFAVRFNIEFSLITGLTGLAKG